MANEAKSLATVAVVGHMGNVSSILRKGHKHNSYRKCRFTHRQNMEEDLQNVF